MPSFLRFGLLKSIKRDVPEGANMRKRIVLIGLMMSVIFTLIGCGKLKQTSDQTFGDQNFKTSIALIELHKVRTGEYPERLEDLEFLGDWDEIYLSGVEYNKLEDGYELNLVKGWDNYNFLVHKFLFLVMVILFFYFHSSL